MDKADKDLLEELQSQLSQLEDPAPSEEFVRRVSRGLAPRAGDAQDYYVSTWLMRPSEWTLAAVAVALLVLVLQPAELLNRVLLETYESSLSTSLLLPEYDELALVDDFIGESSDDELEEEISFLDYLDEA